MTHQPLFDQIGPAAFHTLSPHPQRPNRQLTVERSPGLDGVTIWDTGESGQTFTMRGYRLLLTYRLARQFYREVKELETKGAYPLALRGDAEPQLLFKVMQVRPVRIGEIVQGIAQGDGITYFGLCELDIDLIPIKPHAGANVTPPPSP